MVMLRAFLNFVFSMYTDHSLVWCLKLYLRTWVELYPDSDVLEYVTEIHYYAVVG